MKKKELKKQLKIQKKEIKRLEALLNDKMAELSALTDEVNWTLRPMAINGMIGSSRLSIKYFALKEAYEKLERERQPLKIRKVIFDDNDHKTILLFEDGTKSVVRCRDGEEAYFQKEVGVQLAYLKRLIGKKEYFKLIRQADTDKKEIKSSSFVPDGYCHEVQYDDFGLPIPDYDPESEIMDGDCMEATASMEAVASMEIEEASGI